MNIFSILLVEDLISYLRDSIAIEYCDIVKAIILHYAPNETESVLRNIKKFPNNIIEMIDNGK